MLVKFYVFGGLGSREGCRGEAGGLLWGLQSAPLAAPLGTEGDLQNQMPSASCSGVGELRWALLPRWWEGPSQYPGQRFPGLVIHNTFSPHAFF